MGWIEAIKNAFTRTFGGNDDEDEVPALDDLEDDAWYTDPAYHAPNYGRPS